MLIVQLTGDFMLMDPDTGQVLFNDRPYLVKSTSFINQRATIGHVTVLKTDVPDDRTDSDWADHYKACDGDLTLALESYMSVPEPPKPVKKARTKA